MIYPFEKNSYFQVIFEFLLYQDCSSARFVKGEKKQCSGHFQTFLANSYHTGSLCIFY